MYLSELKLWNFRKFHSENSEINVKIPSLHLHFQNGINVIVGENNAGKTAIIDSIKYILGTQSREYVRPDAEDFSIIDKNRASKLRIEIIVRGISEQEAGLFLDWLEFEGSQDEQQYILRIILTAECVNERVSYRIEAGNAENGTALDEDAKDLLRAIYLKPLRDADAELTPGRRSRLAQILLSHKIFSNQSKDTHTLEDLFAEANKQVEKYFSREDNGDGQEILTTINSYLTEFMNIRHPLSSKLSISNNSLSDILHKLSLRYGNSQEGLGSLNLLYIAVELLLLHEAGVGLHLGIIEELEAHLHPQAQLRLISFLENKTQNCQFILTTHSTTIGASIDLKKVIICRNNKAFSLAPQYTKLADKHYDFLRRFLDATKANLFFANGLIFVEGDAENILIPTIAKIIGRPLEKYGVSIINIGSLAFAHYAKIFERQNEHENMGMKIAIVTDRDIYPFEYHEEYPVQDKAMPTLDDIASEIKNADNRLSDLNSLNCHIFISPNWTLEYELSLSQFRKRFYHMVLLAQKIQNSKSGYPQENKIKEIYEKKDADFKDWETLYSANSRKNEIIAYNIYQKTILDKDISKAIIAQVFTDSLDDFYRGSCDNAQKLKDRILNSKQLEYIVKAIEYVTESLGK